MIIAIVLALLIQQPAEKKPVPLPGTFAHPFHAYKILLPAGWARGANHAKAQASFYANKEGPYTPRVDLYIHKGVKEFGPFATKLRESFRSAYPDRSEEHTSELQSQSNLVCRLLLEKKNTS